MEPICYLENDENDVILLRVGFRKLGRTDAVRWFRDGSTWRQTLLESAPNELPKVILLDLNLDCENGIECLNWLASQPALGSIPAFIFSSGRIAEEIAQSLHNAAGYIFKPSTLEGWIEIATALADLVDSEGANKLSLGQTSFNPARA